MLSWDDAPPAKQTSYIPLDEDDPGDRRSGRRRSWWTVRPVLPTPLAVKYPPEPVEPPTIQAPAQPRAGVREADGAPAADGLGAAISSVQQAQLERLRSSLSGPGRGEAVAAAAGRQPAQAPTDPNTWSGAQVRLQGQILLAELGKRAARSRPATTDDLLESLTPEHQNVLRRNRPITARVQIAPGPRGNEIVSITAE
jgi:hypothetical protein